MENSLITVSSKQLEVLQTELIQLSINLKNTYEELSFQLKGLAEDWKDDKYDEFDNEFKSSREEIIEISEKYENWANSYLPPRIDITKEYERRKVSIG
ncbi:MAG: hypothetical protein FWH18_06110 [Marinilabiliaceae bacterium]|nr:hypothetical protein [Marinilabiliaceae bacterium]